MGKIVRFQNRVAESFLTLPVCVTLVVLTWCFPLCGNDSDSFVMKLGTWEFELSQVWAEHLLGLSVCLCIAYVIAETNNSLQIIRIRTRLMSCVWMVLFACLPFVHPIGPPVLCAFCYVVALFLLYRCYQEETPVIQVFHCMFCIGVGSLFWIPLIWTGILFFFGFWTILRYFSWRCFWGGLIGLILPYWCWFLWALGTNNYLPLINHLRQLSDLQIPSFSLFLQWPTYWWICWILSASLAVIGIIHFYLTSFNDRLRVRTIFHLYFAQSLFFQIALFLQPNFYPVLMPLFLIVTTPFVAHFFALTHSRVSNLLFCLACMSCFALLVMQLFDFAYW